MNHRIVFTGGGTAGHVTPNIALIQALQQENWEVAYVGSADGIESGMMQALDIPFFAVSNGKLRRYLSLKNLLDPFKIIAGVMQSFWLFFKSKPDVVFSKGGFVAFPVVVGAWLNRVPVVAHESDMTPGLANRLCYPFVKKIALTFAQSQQYFKNTNKTMVTGTPIRPQLFSGNSERGLALCGFTEEKPCLLVIGGSLGAGSINECVRAALPQLTAEYQIIHLCGKGKIDHSLNEVTGYKQLEFAKEELADLYAASSIVVSRSGANSLYEILALGKPHVLIPLSKQASRGDQIQNAGYFAGLGISRVIADEELSVNTLSKGLQDVKEHATDIKQKIAQLNIVPATPQLVAIIKEQVND